ncbi:MAG: acyltransferase 3, partial [Candidatus Solibacter sp.]|nr:acyltransferase 3 [Candidatus Solibacter sp.]
MQSLARLKLESVALIFAFYIRRIFRVYPLSIFTVLAVLALKIPAASPYPFEFPSLTALLSNLALCQNLTLSQSVTGPLWSLPFEVQMYGLLPILFIFLNRKSLFRWLALYGIALTL